MQLYALGCSNMGPTGATADRDANFIHIQLIAEEDFIAYSHHESFNYIILPPAGSFKTLVPNHQTKNVTSLMTVILILLSQDAKQSLSM
jgi:hypothetical protein